MLWLYVTLAILACFLAFWRFWFLRDPERKVPDGENVVSPADGRIIDIVDIKSNSLLIPKGILGKVRTIASDVPNAKYLVSIFMSPLDVHVQRAPVNGRIARVSYQKGRFIAANTLGALVNEKNEILIEDFETAKVIQIAGFIARRIECFVREGEHVVKGQRLGRINLGSQVCVILPKNVELEVKKGERVVAGETVLGVLE